MFKFTFAKDFIFMKNKLLIIFLFSIIFNCYSQNIENNQLLIENEKGEIIINKEEKEIFLAKLKRNKEKETKQLSKTQVNQTAVEMCSNGGFEQHENIGGGQKLKNFLYTIGDPPGPTQCKSLTNTANSYIDIYNPGATSIMATTVPSNLIDPYLGNVNAFDQYALKINYDNSSTYGSIVQGKRFKTNNENYLKFNFKAVLMTVYDSGHTDNQPFVKAKIINNSGTVVSEFCLIGDETNCIYTKIPGSGAAILYTANWQSAMLDISSIANNEEFTVEFMASRCGFGGHFGYMYVDDICILHSNENLQGTIELNPLNKVCSNLPINVCGNYTIPNSGGITATLGTITLNLYNSSGTSVYSTTTTSSLDTINRQFCFTLNAANFPNVINSNYNVGVTATYNVTGSSPCSGTVFNSANDPDANTGWDISFQNCTSACNFDVNTTKLSLCDSNHDGTENFDLTNANASIVNSITGLTFSYFTSFNDANSNINSISNSTSYNSFSKTIYVKVSQNATCFKIIPISLEVKNPNVNISGILNVCSGSTVLTATSGASYLWSNGGTTQSITVTAIGTYTVTVTDYSGCSNTGSVTIEPTQIATTPNVIITQPSCFISSGKIQITSTASEYSFDNGVTWTTNNIKNNLNPGTYFIKIKTINNCISYALEVNIYAALTTYPNYTATNPAFCGDVGSITITTSAPFYSFDNGLTWVTNQTATNLPIGTYKIRTKNAQGCISNFNTVLLSSVTLQAPIFTIINPACGINGSIVINTVSDFYTFNGGTTWVTNNTLTTLVTGSYSIAIKNSLGCTSEYSNAYIKDLQNTVPETSVAQPVCGIGGSIVITTIAAFYSFDNGVTWTTNNTATNLPPNTYYIKVKNASGCVSQVSYNILYVPYIDSPIVQVVQPQCGIDGSVTINTLSDFYSFDGGTTWTTNNYITASSGSLSVLIKNNLGCVSQSTSVYFYAPVIPVPLYTVVQPVCLNSGSITIDTVAAFYSINGGITWVTSPVFNNLVGGYYDIRIKNSLGCVSDFLNIVLNTNYLASPTYTFVDTTCGNIGSITFTSVADFYSINNGATWSTNPFFNNLSGTTNYNLVVKNNAGCISNYIGLSLNQNYLNRPKATFLYPCNGNSGSITFITLSAFYSIDDGATWSTNPIFNNLPSAIYILKIKDANGCMSYPYNVYLNNNGIVSPNVTFIQPICGSNGNITVTTTAAFYSINSGNTWITNPVFSNLNYGYYSVKIKNTAGCISDPVYVDLPQIYISQPNYVVVQPLCGVGGTITITTVAAQYSKDGGSTWQSSPIFTNLAVGSYNIVIKNSLGCVSSGTTVSLDTYYLLNPNITIVQPTCGNSGSITIATTAAEYSFDGGTTWTLNPVLSNLSAGYYRILIKNSQGCTSSPYSMTVVIRDFYLQTPLVSSIQPSCGTGGKITILSTADFYSFDNGTTWTTNHILLNAAAGTYIVKIKNNLGCTSDGNYVYINSFYLPNPTIISTQPTCSVTTGTIKVNTPADQYSFDNGVTWTSNSTLTNVLQGYYYIKIKNSLGCESTSIYTFIYPSQFIPSPPSASVVQPSLCGTTDGKITVNTSATEYSFNNGVTWTTNNVKINLAAGTYYIKTRDNSTSCESAPSIVTLNSGTTLPSPAFSSTSPGCAVQFGSITITTPAAYYSFDDGITFVVSNTKINLASATYYIKIKDAAGCISSASTVVISTATVLAAPNYSIIQPTCVLNIGSISITTSSNLYSFDNGLTFLPSNILSGLSAGNYQIKIKDISGCVSNATSVTINPQPNTPNQPTINVTHPSDCTTSTGIITVNSNGTLFSFDNGVTWNTNNVSGQLLPGTYQVIVKETTTGCASNITTAVINSPPNAPSAPTIIVMQPVTCSNPFGSINITSPAFEYSFDNGSSYSTNTNSGLLPAGTYFIKVKNSSNCESTAITAIINAPTDYPIAPLYSIIQPDCNNNKGSISITTVASEYSFNNGISWSTNPTLNNLLPANYLLQIKNAIGCVSTISNANIIAFTNFTNIPTAITPQIFCIQQNADLNNIAISGSNIKWYDLQVLGNLLPNSTLLIDGTTYYASQTINNCESLRVAVTINIQNTQAPTGIVNQTFCATQNVTLSEIIISGSTIKWYANNTSAIILPNSTLLINGNTYYATQTINGCESVNRLAVKISLTTTLNAVNYSKSFCDDLNDGFEAVVLSDYNSLLLASFTNETFTYYNSNLSAENQILADKINSNYNLSTGNQVVYVRIDSANGCHQVVILNFTLFSNPIINLKDIIPICDNTTVTVNAGSGFDSYVWSNGITNQQSIVINQPGNYSLTVSKNNGSITCYGTKNFTVAKSNTATISSIEKIDLTNDGLNTISVFLSQSSIGNYEYSLDGINYQDSPTFNNLTSGIYTVYVNDKNNCGKVTDDVFLMMFPVFFTPNDDGYNDFWKIKLSELEPGLTITIFDRFGKLLKYLDNDDIGWDGNYNQNPLPADDYWFVIKRTNGKEIKNHFTLKR